jgi:hypothetical protein
MALPTVDFALLIFIGSDEHQDCTFQYISKLVDRFKQSFTLITIPKSIPSVQTRSNA